MLLRLIFDRDIHMDVFPQLIIADVACIHPFPALPDTGFKIQGFSVFLFHIPFQVPENTRAAPVAKFIGSLNTMQRQLSPAGSTTVSRKLGRMDMPISRTIFPHSLRIMLRSSSWAFGRDTVLGS